MIAELDKFREKYPQYKDINDSDLATKLANKYPDAYGDLPKKVQTSIPVGQMLLNNAGLAARDTAEFAGKAGNEALLGIPGAVSKLSTGGKLVMPLTQGRGLNTVEGGTNVFEGNDLSEGQKAMATGAGMVVPVGGIIKGVGELPMVKGLIKPFKEGKQIEGDFNALKQEVGIPEESTKGYIGETINSKIADAQKSASERISKINLDVKSRLEDINNQQSLFEQGILKTTPENFASYMKKEGIQWSAKGSEAYGKEINRISEMIPKDTPITSESASGMLNNIVQRADAEGVKSPMLKKIRALADDYSGQYNTNVIDFGKLKSQLSNIYTHVSPSLRSGKYFEGGDRVSSMVKDNWINFIKDYVPKEGVEAYSKLQQNYSRFAQAKREIGTMFHPYSGEFDMTAGINSAKRIAEDNLNIGKENLMNVMEKGIPGFVPGMNKFSEQAQALTKMGQQNKLFEAFPGLIKSSGKLAKSSINDDLAQKVNRYTAWNKKYSDLIELEKRNKEAKDKIENILSMGLKPAGHFIKKSIGF